MKAKDKNADERIRDLEKRCTNLSRRVGSVEQAVKLMDADEANKSLTRALDRLNYLSRRLEIEILKNVVLSEVTRIYPDAWPRLLSFLDNSDDWWAKGSDLSIEEWAKRSDEDSCSGGVDEEDAA